MIDFIKIRVINTDPKVLLNNPLLEFKQEVSVKTGELSKNVEAIYKGLKFIVYASGVIIVQGSLHKYMNNGKHNYDDFYRSQLAQVISEFLSTFNLSDRNCTLVNVEVSANVIPPIPSKELINYMILHHRKVFKYGDVRNGHYKQIAYREYILKAYDKSTQYQLSTQKLQKVCFFEYFFQLFLLSDLLNINTYFFLQTYFEL